MFEKAEIEALKPYIKDYLRQHDLDVSGKKCFRCLNPAHEDKHPSMGYNPTANNVHCFACGKTYDIFDLVGLERNISNFREKVEEVRCHYGSTHTCSKGGDSNEQ